MLSPIPPPSQSSSYALSELPTMMNMTSKQFVATWKSYIKGKPWSLFFDAHSKQNKAQLQHETPQQHQTWLNHEQDPPFVSAEVYEWAWCDEDPLIFIQTCVWKKEWEDVLQSYGKSQLRYDAFQNGWDVCKYFNFFNNDRKQENTQGNTTNTDISGMNENWGDNYDWSNNEGEIDKDEDDVNNNGNGEQASHMRYISTHINQLSMTVHVISWLTTQFQSEVEMDLTGTSAYHSQS